MGNTLLYAEDFSLQNQVSGTMVSAGRGLAGAIPVAGNSLMTLTTVDLVIGLCLNDPPGENDAQEQKFIINPP